MSSLTLDRFDPVHPTAPDGYPTPMATAATTTTTNTPHALHPLHPPHSPDQNNPSHEFPWKDVTHRAAIICNNARVLPHIHAKVDKGFFTSAGEKKWTCYRRNYFTVHCSHELPARRVAGLPLILRRDGHPDVTIQAMGLRLTAAVSKPDGKAIALIQHTPKRDHGPKRKIDIVAVEPAAPPPDPAPMGHHPYAQPPLPGPRLPLQHATDPDSAASSACHSPTNTCSAAAAAAAALGSGPAFPYHTAPYAPRTALHVFERVQFATATANNGKRRASQEFFRLAVELWVDVRDPAVAPAPPHWILAAERRSGDVVVRGRSPSHYQHESQNGHAGRAPAAGASAGAATPGPVRPSGYGATHLTPAYGPPPTFLPGPSFRTTAHSYAAPYHPAAGFRPATHHTTTHHPAPLVHPAHPTSPTSSDDGPPHHLRPTLHHAHGPGPDPYPYHPDALAPHPVGVGYPGVSGVVKTEYPDTSSGAGGNGASHWDFDMAAAAVPRYHGAPSAYYS